MAKKTSKHVKKDYHTWPVQLHVAYCIDYRELHPLTEEKEMTFVFVGATGPLLHEVFSLLCHGGYIISGFKLDFEHIDNYCRRNGHHYWQWRVTPSGYNEQFLSIDNLRFLIEKRICDKGHLVTYFENYNQLLKI